MKLLVAIQTAYEQGNTTAKSYANWLLLNWDVCSNDEFESQLLYILSNLSHWRGADARASKLAIRTRLAEFTK